jgi:hypothetical protein
MRDRVDILAFQNPFRSPASGDYKHGAADSVVFVSTHVLGIETRADSAIANRQAGSKFLDLVIIANTSFTLVL